MVPFTKLRRYAYSDVVTVSSIGGSTFTSESTDTNVNEDIL